MAMATNNVCTECKKDAEKGVTICARCVEDCELLTEDVTLCPPFLTSEDFERFVRKLAVHAHANQDPDDEQLTIDRFEISLAEQVAKALPRFYVSNLDYDAARVDVTSTAFVSDSHNSFKQEGHWPVESVMHLQMIIGGFPWSIVP